jgi:hypothetical protein
VGSVAILSPGQKKTNTKTKQQKQSMKASTWRALTTLEGLLQNHKNPHRFLMASETFSAGKSTQISNRRVECGGMEFRHLFQKRKRQTHKKISSQLRRLASESKRERVK